jgi:hypothetical protein
MGMKKMISLLNAVNKKIVFTLLCLFFLCISCTKEFSATGPPPGGTVSIFTNQAPAGKTLNDSLGGIELGVKFQSAVAGNIEGIKFYKTSRNIGTHTAQLYSSDGTLLASKVFINETDSGWQSVLFDTAASIAANTTYIAAYHSSLGNYISTIDGLKTAITNGPLTALADGTDGINGLYKYTNTPDLPDRGYLSSNYWIDVIASDQDYGNFYQ